LESRGSRVMRRSFFFKKISSNSPAERAVAVVALRRVGTFLLVVKRFFLEAAVPSVSIHNFFFEEEFFWKAAGRGSCVGLFSFKKISSNKPAECTVAVMALHRVGTFLLVGKRFFLESHGSCVVGVFFLNWPQCHQQAGDHSGLWRGRFFGGRGIAKVGFGGHGIARSMLLLRDALPIFLFLLFSNVDFSFFTMLISFFNVWMHHHGLMCLEKIQKRSSRVSATIGSVKKIKNHNDNPADIQVDCFFLQHDKPKKTTSIGATLGEINKQK